MLTDDQVIEMRHRHAAGETAAALAAVYGVSRQAASAILTGQRRAEVDGPIRQPLSDPSPRVTPTLLKIMESEHAAGDTLAVIAARHRLSRPTVYRALTGLTGLASRYTTVPQMLREACARHRVTQAELAELLGESPRTVEQWVQGRRRPSIGLLSRALRLLELELGDRDQQPPQISSLRAGRRADRPI